MSFFNWAKRFFTAEHTSDEPQESSALQQLQAMHKTHSLLDIRVPRLGEQRCQSMVIDIDPQEGYLILDEPFPRLKLESGDLLHITCRLKDRSPVEFQSTLLRKQSHNGNTNYLLELPESIQGNDELDHYRIYVDKENIALELQLNNHEIIQCHVIALTFDSIKFQILGEHDEHFDAGKQFKNSVLRLPEEMIDCHLTLLQSFNLVRPTPHLLCTATLQLDQNIDSKKFNQYLAALQRQQRRRELRLI